MLYILKTFEIDLEKVEKSQLIWKIHILFQPRLRGVSPVYFQALMMK